MIPIKQCIIIGIVSVVMIFNRCDQSDQIDPIADNAVSPEISAVGNGGVLSPEISAAGGGGVLSPEISAAGGGGVLTANGWYEEEEIYYILSGVEEGVTQRGQNDLYLIGGDRAFQANVAEFIPGEPGYSPHWNVNVVHSAPGVTLYDILASPYVSGHHPEALFDDVEDILDAEAAGLVTIVKPGIVVLCPVISEQGAEAPGNTELPEEFPTFPDTF
jgi:hypothetical protein